MPKKKFAKYERPQNTVTLDKVAYSLLGMCVGLYFTIGFLTVYFLSFNQVNLFYSVAMLTYAIMLLVSFIALYKLGSYSNAVVYSTIIFAIATLNLIIQDVLNLRLYALGAIWCGPCAHLTGTVPPAYLGPSAWFLFVAPFAAYLLALFGTSRVTRSNALLKFGIALVILIYFVVWAITANAVYA
ncbi:Uncharacterised protein [uncultured archaeon]|nr:Uncharacterised protein [uncultured archaeon]